MSKIVVGVDGSDHAHEALHWALEEARLRGATLTVVLAYMPTPQDFFGFPGEISAAQLEAVAEESDRQAAQTLEAVMERAGDLAKGVDVRTEAASGESPPEALVSRSGDADLLVVGSRGRGGFKGMLLGSVSQQVTQHAHCPVVVVGKRG